MSNTSGIMMAVAVVCMIAVGGSAALVAENTDNGNESAEMVTVYFDYTSVSDTNDIAAIETALTNDGWTFSAKVATKEFADQEVTTFSNNVMTPLWNDMLLERGGSMAEANGILCDESTGMISEHHNWYMDVGKG